MRVKYSVLAMLVALSTLVAGAEDSIGTATMEKDGTIVMTMNIGMTQLRYPKGHKQYAETLKHLKGLKPGETKPIPPYSDSTK